MGVGSGLLGRKVICPHCKQKVLAPAAASTTPAASSPPAPPKSASNPAHHSDLPVFNIPKREAVDSIFGDHQDESDDVFSSGEGTRLPRPDYSPPDLPAPPIAKSTPPPAKPMPEASYAPTVEVNSPFTGAAGPGHPPPPAPRQSAMHLPPISAPVLVPLPPPPVAPIPTVNPIPAIPGSVPGSNPWIGLEAAIGPPSAGAPAPSTISEVRFPAVEADRQRRESRPPAEAAASGPLKIALFVLVPYAAIVTALAVHGLFFKSALPAEHPLSLIPDTFGEFAPAERKKSGRLAVPLDGPLPPELRVALGSGNKLTVGQLEIEPLGIEERGLKIVVEGKNGSEKFVQSETAPALVLRLNVKNTSSDLLIHPFDPAFNRKAAETDRVGTGIVVGKQTFWGGAIEWPFPGRVGRKYEAAQEADAVPLKPGETREFVVAADANPKIAKAARESQEPLLWRVQVRRGRIDFRGQDIPVTAILGVEFKPSDVRGSNE